MNESGHACSNTWSRVVNRIKSQLREIPMDEVKAPRVVISYFGASRRALFRFSRESY